MTEDVVQRGISGREFKMASIWGNSVYSTVNFRDVYRLRVLKVALLILPMPPYNAEVRGSGENNVSFDSLVS